MEVTGKSVLHFFAPSIDQWKVFDLNWIKLNPNSDQPDKTKDQVTSYSSNPYLLSIKWANPGLFFVYFSPFQTQILHSKSLQSTEFSPQKS